MSVEKSFRAGLLASCALVAAGLATAHAAEAEKKETVILGPLRVDAQAQAERADGPAEGYVARRSATGTKSDIPLIETPQSITVVTRAQMDATASDSLEQAFAYSAGITPLTGAQKTISTSFTMRGFNVTGSQPLYLNGSKFPINSLSGSMDPYLFERMELLKGPASLLYGQAPPGGIINLVSRRPTPEPMGEVVLQGGSWDSKQAAFDLGGPITADGRFGYRLTGLVRDADSMIEQIPNDRTSLAAAFDWTIADGTQLTALASYNKAESLYDYGKPLDGALLPNPNGKLSRKLFVGEPGFDFFDTEGWTAGYTFEHEVSDSWTVKQNLLVYGYDAQNAWAAISGRANAATNLRTVNRSATTRDDTDDGYSVDTQVHGKLATGPIDHTLLFGLDWTDGDFKRIQRSGTVAPLDLFAPVYGSPVTLGAASQSLSGRKQLGVYVQDHLKFGEHWIVLLSGRYDDAKNTSRTITATGATTRSVQKSHAFSPRAGLLYLFDNGVAPYYSYARSFQPTSGTDFFLRQFVPSRGTQHEIGVKYEPEGLDASITLAAYELTQTNVLTADLAHPGFSIQTGEQRSRGIELEGRASLDEHWDLVGAVTYTDAKITRSNTGLTGTRPTSVPKVTAALWADYRFGALLPGVEIGAGIRHTGVQEISRMDVPSFTVVDAALRYNIDNWRFALNVKNLTDNTYFMNCTYACFFGDERNVTVTAAYRW